MTVKIARLKSNEDVIADIKETYDDKEQLVAYMFNNPYVVTHYLDNDDYDFDEESEVDIDDVARDGDGGNLIIDIESLGSGLPEKPFAIEKVRLQFYPWCPLSSDKSLFVHYDWVISAYEPYSEIKEKYLQLLEEMCNGN